jgi:hypothetical protein
MEWQPAPLTCDSKRPSLEQARLNATTEYNHKEMGSELIFVVAGVGPAAERKPDRQKPTFLLGLLVSVKCRKTAHSD